MPAAYVNVRANANLKFSHSRIPKPLIIREGASAIQWSYNLITQSTATYGGEVIQILGVNVGTISMSGQTSSNTILKQIYDWMRKYMILAGTDARVEEPVLFEYPERGWRWKMHITKLAGFRYATDALGTPWQISAEMVGSSTENALAQTTRNGMTDVLNKEYLQRVGYQSTGVQKALTDPLVSAALGGGVNNFGENFQRLVASWSTGDFTQWAFEAMKAPDQQFSQSSEDYWKAYFGTQYISGWTGASGGVSTDGATSSGGGSFLPGANVTVKGAPASAHQLANLTAILSKGDSSQAPDKVLIAAIIAATQESTLKTSATNGNHVGLFQMDSDKGSEAERRDPAFAANWFFNVANNVGAIKYAEDHSGWGPAEIAEAVEISGQPGNYTPHISEAENTLAEWRKGATASTGGGGIIAGAIEGSPVPGIPPHSSTHQTGGLPGYPAYDYMAPAGTPCVAPVDGTIARFSGHDPSLGGPPGGPLGYSIYLDGDNGKSYYMTHLDKRVCEVGDKVKQGQQIAEVANGPSSWSSPHVHMGVNG